MPLVVGKYHRVAATTARRFPEHQDHQKAGRQAQRGQAVGTMPGRQRTVNSQEQKGANEEATTHIDAAS
jgi:hypothetical protein